ncbi:hypothetical protein HWV62_28158 [Athelia sp. TMB]|nr:hypothetical protein HWV62_28158 [Athelia sp. TMB]
MSWNERTIVDTFGVIHLRSAWKFMAVVERIVSTIVPKAHEEERKSCIYEGNSAIEVILAAAGRPSGIHMSRNKKPRIVTSQGDTLNDPPPPPSDITYTTCTSNNARRLAAARTVTLRTRKNTRHQSQRSTHTQVQESIEESTRAQDASNQDETLMEGMGEEDTGDVTGDGGEKPTGPKKPAARPCKDWVSHRPEYLDELLRHDGLRDSDTPLKCPVCGEEDGIIKCVDCISGPLKCARCTVECHQRVPLHRLQRWCGTHFVDETLQNIGLVLQLGHDGGQCPCPGLKSTDFEVLGVSGQHTITLWFCGCLGAPRERVQLLRSEWFPASTEQPNSAFTFDVLNTFQLISLQGKLSAYDFYLSLVHKIDNLGILRRADEKSTATGPRDRYEQFLTVIRVWRHLTMLKRAGRGHDPLGIMATVEGECAVECPACPLPGKNLPRDWKLSDESIRWIYALILAIDANFKLSLKEKGILDDPALGDGWAHWVPREEFMDYLRENGGAVEPNYCDSDLKAINTAVRNTKNYKASGAAACLCGRHGFVRKNGLGSLQIGERYPNIDFIVFCGLVRTILFGLWFSYDIACQWSRNLLKHVLTLPERMQIAPDILKSATKVLPKFHEYNHGYSCQTEYSLNITQHAGRTNAEDPERWWSYINPASMSTKEMGEGSREDTLDDFARSYNFRKITGFGIFYPPKIEEAIEMRATHQRAFDQFDTMFPVEVTKKWNDKVLAWDADHSCPNPYVEPTQATSIASLKLELAEEEASDAAQGVLRTQDKSLSTFVVHALDLEEEQRLIILWTKNNSTDLQASVRQEKRNTLRLRIARFRETQITYMPGVAVLRNEGVKPVTPSAHDIVHHPAGVPPKQKPAGESKDNFLPEREYLWLPSAIPQEMREQACVPGLIKIETCFQLAVMDDALVNLRRQIRISSSVRGHTQANGGGTSQKLGTRSLAVVARFREKIDRCAARYRAAYAALMSLDPNGEWKTRLFVLQNEDLRSLHRKREDDGAKPKKRKRGEPDRPSEGWRQLSWIWLHNGPLGRPTTETMTSDQVNDNMRAEWCRMKARADRWSEEYIWLVEEMRRILSYFDWKAGWWCSRRGLRTDASPAVLRGLNAYAEKQAALITKLGHKFARIWYPMHQKHAIKVEWPAEFIPTPAVPTSSI